MVAFSSLYGERLSRELGNQDSTILFTTARRKSAINEAQFEFADLTECRIRHSTFTISGGIKEYDVGSTTVLDGSSQFSRFTLAGPRYQYTDASSNVTILAGDDLPRRDIVWLDRYVPGWELSTTASSNRQDPQVWYMRWAGGGTRLMGFWPTPSTGSSASAQVTIPFVSIPASMTADGDQPFGDLTNGIFPFQEYHQGLVHYAAHLLEKFRRDDAASDRQLQKFLAYVARFLGQERQRGPRVVTYTKNYYSVRGSDRGKDPRT